MTLIAIDGPAGAGKTTLAAKFERELSINNSVSVIHMDDLYAGWENALDEQLTLRLKKIVEAFTSHNPFTISIFNWHTYSFDSFQTIEPTDVLIIEGVGAGQKVVRESGATVYWLDIEPSIGLERVLARDGREYELQMRTWQIDQERFFESDLTRNHADHIMTS
jgi:uridine kinase